MSKYRRHIKNKWAKHEVLRRSRRLSRYMPATKPMNLDSFRSMLEQYRMLYVKPVVGSLGKGVMRVKLRNGTIHTQSGTIKHSFDGWLSAYNYVSGVAGEKPYMVQQGIRMKRYRRRPFDIRLMIQRKPGRKWRVTGWAARLAHRRKVVTNGSQGGTIYPLRTLLPRSRRVVRKLKRIGLRSARRLRSVYPGLNMIGLDVAVDRRRRLWILEANTNPDPCPFTKLPRRRMLRRILRYARANGRRYRLRCTKSHRGR